MTPPALYFKENGIAARVLERCEAIKQPFNPTVWAPNGHVQSALGLLRTLSARGSYTRQLVMTSDHGTLGLDWWCGADTSSYAAADAPIIMFIHGINGGSHEGYVKWACVAAASRGWRAVVLNMRGCNGLPITSARGYNAINTGDVHVAVQSIRGRFPAAPLMAAGYSLGSVLLAKYLAESDNGYYSSSSSSGSVGGSTPVGQQQSDSQAAAAGGGAAELPDLQHGSGLVAAALVSPPVCLHTTNSKMGRPTSVKFLYNLAVAYKLREYVREHMDTMHAQGVNIDADAMLNSWTVSSFDDAVTLKALGYPAPDHYYRHACGTNYIPHIRTPTLIMLSRDDPFLGVLPQEQVQHNPFTLLAATRRGGHLAFLQGWWPLGASYCDAVIDDWMQAALQEWRYGPTGQAAVTSSSASSGSRTQLPSWVDRAQALGWQPQPFDPQSLAHAMCTCNPELDPLGQAQAADALLNASPAAPAAAAIAAGKAAAKRARHSWSFGFGGRLAPAGEAADSRVVGGLRGGGAWAPFEAAGGRSGRGSSSISRGAVGLLGTSPAAAAAAATEAAAVEASAAAAEEQAAAAMTGLLRPAAAEPDAAGRPLLSKL